MACPMQETHLRDHVLEAECIIMTGVGLIDFSWMYRLRGNRTGDSASCCGTQEVIRVIKYLAHNHRVDFMIRECQTIQSLLFRQCVASYVLAWEWEQVGYISNIAIMAKVSHYVSNSPRYGYLYSSFNYVCLSFNCGLV
jgi:hypothetical protein